MSEKEKLSALEKEGFIVEDGLSYSAEEPEFYFELLGDYADSYDSKCALLNDLYEANDMDQYRIQIHALKSTSKTIGAADVYAASKALENAAKENDADFIHSHHAECLELFKSKAKVITTLIQA